MRITVKSTRTFLAPILLTFSLLTAATVSVGQANAAEMATTAPAVAGTTTHAGPPTSGNVSSSTVTSRGTSTQSFSTESAAETYWTAARMARAAARSTTTTAAAKPTMGRTAPVKPAPATIKATTVPPVAGTLAAGKTEPLRALVTRPYTNRPDRLNGKVFFTLNGQDYVCSGTIVNSSNKDMVDTAGHCVSDGAGHFATNWVFVPGYASKPSAGRAGMYPYGIWTARQLTTTAQWHYYGNIKQDLAYGVLKPLNNRHIAAYLGGQGISFNASRNQTFNAFGYPQAAPFNGRDQRLSVSKRIGDDTLLGGLPGPLPLRISSNQTGGASGGGWIVSISATSGLGYVNGHNSYRYLSGPAASANQLYSPYFGSEALALYNYTRTL
jgi:hypothetical protein